MLELHSILHRVTNEHTRSLDGRKKWTSDWTKHGKEPTYTKKTPSKASDWGKSVVREVGRKKFTNVREDRAQNQDTLAEFLELDRRVNSWNFHKYLLFIFLCLQEKKRLRTEEKYDRTDPWKYSLHAEKNTTTCCVLAKLIHVWLNF